MSLETSPMNGLSQLHRIEASNLFQGSVIAIIILSALTIGAKTYDLPPLVEHTLTLLDSAITVFFLVEILFRFFACPEKKRFLLDGWNLFDTIVVIGSLIPLDNSEAVLLGRLLRVFRVQHDFDINIQGHTDNLPISTSRYETNWELSDIRATTVLRYFIDRGIPPRRLTATGYGASLPIASNDPPAARASPPVSWIALMVRRCRNSMCNFNDPHNHCEFYEFVSRTENRHKWATRTNT